MNISKDLLVNSLEKSYSVLSPYADKQRWEFDSNLFHLQTIVENISEKDKIIDIGCGIGLLALALKYLGYDICGIDHYIFEPTNSYNVKDIDNLKKIWQKEGLSIKPEDILNNSQNMNYDIALSIAVIEHQRNLNAYINNLYKYVKLGGKIYIATPNVSNFLNRFRMLLGKAPMANIEQFYKDGDNFNGHWREYTVDELKKITIASGKEVILVGNKQTTKPRFNRDFKKWHVSIARLFGYIFPRTGDTNFIWIKK